MKKPDNIVFNEENNEYHGYKLSYPTSFTSKNFEIDKLVNLKKEAQPYFQSKFSEIKKEYDLLITKLKWNEIIVNAKFNFNPIVGQKYYLYENKKNNFLSIISPNEWNMKYLGTFVLLSNFTWQKTK